MRSAAAALALGLLLVASGCGSSSAAIQTSSGTDAASLVPASALAYVSVDANLDSEQWQVLTDVFGPLPSKLDYKNDIHPAIGDHVNIAVLGVDNGEPEAVALVKPTNEAKLRALAKKYDQGSEHHTGDQTGGRSGERAVPRRARWGVVRRRRFGGGGPGRAQRRPGKLACRQREFQERDV